MHDAAAQLPGLAGRQKVLADDDHARRAWSIDLVAREYESVDSSFWGDTARNRYAPMRDKLCAVHEDERAVAVRDLGDVMHGIHESRHVAGARDRDVVHPSSSSGQHLLELRQRDCPERRRLSDKRDMRNASRVSPVGKIVRVVLHEGDEHLWSLGAECCEHPRETVDAARRAAPMEDRDVLVGIPHPRTPVHGRAPTPSPPMQSAPRRGQCCACFHSAAGIP